MEESLWGCVTKEEGKKKMDRQEVIDSDTFFSTPQGLHSNCKQHHVPFDVPHHLQ